MFKQRGGMTKVAVTLELSSDLFYAVHDLASEQEGTVGSVVEELLASHLATTKKAHPTTKIANDRLVFALQKLLFRDLAEASSWEELDARLSKHGYYLRIAWGGLSLHSVTSGQKLCNLHDMGFSYGTFVRRFGPGKPKDPNAA